MGGGVYVADLELACKFARRAALGSLWADRNGAIIKVQFTTNNPKYVTGNYKTWQREGHDACRAEQTSCADFMEWCIKDPSQITIISIGKISFDIGWHLTPQKKRHTVSIMW